ncbi:MAG: gluconate 2-dehydrogenase subunit 3 family protein [Cyclobacterium sp.]|uniref:gluconate 2-dehydrogenase subunit 3 family protein n=1 Tax=unclassified Cyclobacterium TaxID=2615055 RepID=UPI0013D29842|nr:gluconate 2-dehydrogenase subunit 3 family protein [Cyclobacterium sp. SYSU L10401]
MNRRENLKLLFTGSLASGFLFTGCGPEAPETTEIPHNPTIGEFGSYGRTPEEIIHNENLKSSTFFTDEERKKLDVLVDIIIPADDTSGSATDAGVPDFIEFMMKDIPSYQTPMRGGLLWLDHKSDEMFGSKFLEISEDQRIQIIDEIAYPDKAKAENEGGVRFFNMLRNLTATGFFTSEEGFKDLGYVGNKPNAWDGVPEEVLAKHGLQNDPKYKDVYLDISTRGTIAQWDDEGNLIG